MEEASIETRAIERFMKNLSFLEREAGAVYEKVMALENAISTQYHKERYALQYRDEGYFDVLELSSGKYLYGSDSNAHAQLAAKSINYEKQENLFETFYDVAMDDDVVGSYDDVGISSSQYSASARIINYHNKYADKEKTTMKKIYKFIFFGTGLGLHLQTIHEKLQSHVYFIVEDDLELFRLSLFVTDYELLTKQGAKLYFSIFADREEFHEDTERFLHEMFIYNHFLKYFHILNHSEDKIKEFQKVVLSQSYIVFNYSALTAGMLRPLSHIEKGYNILNISHKYTNKVITQKPFLLLGAGPSIHHNLEWIKENQDRFVIVAVTALLSMLEEHKIKPSIITHVHGFDDALPHVQKVKDMHFFDETIVLFSTFTTPKFLSYFKKENVFLFQGSSQFKKDFGSFSASNIGALSYGLLLSLGVENFYLLGLDFALDAKTGETHTQSHEYKKKIDQKKTKYALEDTISYTKSAIVTEGNFQKEVTTNIMFDAFKEQCNLMTRVYKRETTQIYNLSNGALLNDVAPLHVKDIKLSKFLNKENIFYSLEEEFSKNSQNYLTEDDIKTLQAKLAYIRGLHTIVLQYKNRKYSTMDEFHYHLLGLYQEILAEEYDKNATELNQVIMIYLEYSTGFIFDIINTKELQNPKHHIKKLNKIIIDALEKLVIFYEESLDNFLKREGEKKSK